MKKVFFTLLIFIVILATIILTVSLIVGDKATFFGKATEIVEDSEISAENSYVFASPLKAKAGNQEKVRITVFILNSKGLGVSGKIITLSSNTNLNIYDMQSVTDNYGKAIFDISADEAGEHYIDAKAGNITLPQKVKVTFY